MFPVWPQRGHFPVQVVAASRWAGRGADAAQVGFKIFVKNEDFKFHVKYNVKIS